MAILMLFLSAFFVWIALNALIECGVSQDILDYSELAIHGFGKKGEVLVNLAVIISNFGALLSYINIAGVTTSEILQSWTDSCGGQAVDPCGPPVFLLSCLSSLFVF